MRLFGPYSQKNQHKISERKTIQTSFTKKLKWKPETTNFVRFLFVSNSCVNLENRGVLFSYEISGKYGNICFLEILMKNRFRLTRRSKNGDSITTVHHTWNCVNVSR